VRTATVAETDPFYLVEGRFVGVVHDFALAEDYRSGRLLLLVLHISRV
jgi:hypothetical protein